MTAAVSAAICASCLSSLSASALPDTGLEIEIACSSKLVGEEPFFGVLIPHKENKINKKTVLELKPFYGNKFIKAHQDSNNLVKVMFINVQFPTLKYQTRRYPMLNIKR